MKKKTILFHDDNAPSHTWNITQAKKHELGFESLPYPPYSPELAPSDYYEVEYLYRVGHLTLGILVILSSKGIMTFTN